MKPQHSDENTETRGTEARYHATRENVPVALFTIRITSCKKTTTFYTTAECIAQSGVGVLPEKKHFTLWCISYNCM